MTDMPRFGQPSGEVIALVKRQVCPMCIHYRISQAVAIWWELHNQGNADAELRQIGELLKERARIMEG